MTNPSRHRLPALAAALLTIGFAACSGDSGPAENGGAGRLAGLLSVTGSSAAAALAGTPGDQPLAGVTVRLVSASGAVLFETGTDPSGEFELEAPAGSYRLEVLAGGASFILQLELQPGRTLFVQGVVDATGPAPVIDAELFLDDDGDGVSDTGFTIRIVGREAGDPGSGETLEEGDPDADLEEEDETVQDRGPADLAELEDGQKVYVKGAAADGGFLASEVHGSSGNAGPSCRLSGAITGAQLDGAGELETIELFGVSIEASGARVTGVRGGGAALEPGTRVEIHASFDAGSGELVASRIHARGSSRGGDPERILGFLTAEPDAGNGVLELCGIAVQVAEGAKVTNGDGGGEGEDGEGDEDGDGDGSDDDVSFGDFLAAVGGGAFNHDVRGRFDEAAGLLAADHVTVADRERSGVEIAADVADLDLAAGTFTLLGLPVRVVSATEFRGGLEDLQSLEDGLHVRARIQAADGGALVASSIQRGSEPFDRLRGGSLGVVSDDVDAAPNLTVGLPESLELAVDVDAGTTFGIGD